MEDQSKSTVFFGIGAGVLTAFLVILCHYWGWFQSFDLMLYDKCIRWRQPLAPPDDRIMLVGITESDLQHHTDQTWPLTDDRLAAILTTITAGKPVSIGLDLYRDIPIPYSGAEMTALDRVLLANTNIIAICKIAGIDSQGISPPRVLVDHPDQVGFNDFPIDSHVDDVVRRALLFADDGQRIYHSLALRLALHYLAREKIRMVPSETNPSHVKLGKTTMTPFSANDGLYVNADDRGYQFFLDFLGPERFTIVPIHKLLNGEISPQVFNGKIVIFGAVAESLKDLNKTPLRYNHTGVELHALVVNQILRHAINGAPLLVIWPPWAEVLWIILWCLVGGWIGFGFNSPVRATLGLLFGLFLISGIAWELFQMNHWIPWLEPLVGCFSAGVLAVISLAYNRLQCSLVQLKSANNQLLEYNQNLETKVADRTRELSANTVKLEKAIDELRQAQKQMVTQEKLASLGTLTAGIAHEIKNPLNFINNFSQLSQWSVNEIEQLLVTPENGQLNNDHLVVLKDHIADLSVNLSKITDHGKRADSIIKSMLSHSREKTSEKQMVELNSLLDEYLNLVLHGKHLDHRGYAIPIKKNYADDIGHINMYPQEFGQVIINILNNAFEALIEKRQLTGNSFNPSIQVSTINHESQVEIRIRDNGPGIPLEVREKIFTPFFTTKPAGKGTGLGMSISHDIIVNLHKGQFQYDSVPGQYTEFIIKLPT